MIPLRIFPRGKGLQVISMVNREKQRARAVTGKAPRSSIDGWTVRDHGENFNPENITCRNCGGNNWRLIGSISLGACYLCSDCGKDSFIDVVV